MKISIDLGEGLSLIMEIKDRGKSRVFGSLELYHDDEIVIESWTGLVD